MGIFNFIVQSEWFGFIPVKPVSTSCPMGRMVFMFVCLTVSSSCCSWDSVPARSAKLAMNDILAFSL